MEIQFQNGAHLIHTRILLTVLNLIFAFPILRKKIKFIMYGFSLVQFLLLILLRAILGQ